MSTPPQSPLPTQHKSSSDGRCGMCGACGSMPPWAPEVLANATPAARRAVLQRMEEARLRFIKERDATNAAQARLEAVTNTSSPSTLSSKHSSLSSPTLQDRPVSPIQKLSPNIISMSQLSLKENDTSDADSFKTADDQDESIQKLLAQVPDLDDMSQIDIHDDNPTETVPTMLEYTDERSITPNNENCSPSPQTPQRVYFEKNNSINSIASDSLEGSVASRQQARKAHNRDNSFLNSNDFVFPSELQQKRSVEIELQPEITLTPRTACADCEIWRARVQELELRVEALTSALAAREMEHVALRARASDRIKSVPKSEARLAQECESLRVTTEFLYKRLEKYENERIGTELPL